MSHGSSTMVGEAFRCLVHRGGGLGVLLGISLLWGLGHVWAVQAQPNTVRVATDRLRVEMDPASGTMALAVRTGDTTWSQTPVPGLFLDGKRQDTFDVEGSSPLLLRNEQVRVKLERLSSRAIAATWTTRDTAKHAFDLRLRSTDQTAYYGTGERFTGLNQRGMILPFRVDDRYGNKGVGAYKPVPFFMSTQGFGTWVDSYAPATFDLSGARRFRTSLQLTDTKLRVVWMAGPGPEAILKEFTRLTGRPDVPPPWAFGLWKSRDVHHNQDSVMVDVRKLRQHDIPASVLVLDSPWSTGYNDFEVNTQQFPRPAEMFDAIRESGLQLSLWLAPFINKTNVQDMEGIEEQTSTYEEAASKGYLVTDSTGAVALSDWWKGTGGLIDVTDPEAVQWWYDQLDKTKKYHVRAFKADDGEGNFVPDAVFHDGTSARKMTNRYAALYDSIMHRYVTTRMEPEGTLITRSGYTGTQAVPFDWAGDNHASFSFHDGLPSVIRAGQNAALTGISFWGSDIAGYAGTPSKELFLRWTQFGAFSPLMQVHMTSNLGPWDFDAETLRVFRKFAELRTELFPYLYTAAHETAEMGLPVMRPMAMAFPADERAARRIYQYMFGPDLLVAPMYRPGTHRSVYLPEGTWINYWSREQVEGPTTREVHAPLSEMPLFVRAGSILPRIPDDVETLARRSPMMDSSVTALDERRILEVWPGTTGRVETWDGVSARLQTNEARTTLRIRSETARPLAVHLVGRRIPELEAEGATVRYDVDADRTVLRFSSFRGARTLTWASTSPDN